MKNKNDIMESLSCCCDCNQKYYSPFYFPIKNQEVMAITASPSMQAMYKPLYSIRFFRKLCLVLFGDKYLSENYLREFCDGNIYWTHYYKCLLPPDKNYDNMKSKCAKKYLHDEIRELHPKLIIVLGSETDLGEKIERIVSETGYNISSDNYIARQFPVTGAESCYEKVRNMIKPFIHFMKDDNEDDFLTGKYSYNIDNLSQGNSVHLNFELAALKNTIEKPNNPDKTIEYAWNEKIVVPNLERYSKIISTYSFIETQIKIMLTNHLITTENTTIFKSMRCNSALVNPTCKEAIRYISENSNWLRAFGDYVLYVNESLYDETKKLLNEIDNLREIRNYIVHKSGFVDKKTFSNHINGIYILENTILVTKEAENSMLDMANRIVELMKKVEI